MAFFQNGAENIGHTVDADRVHISTKKVQAIVVTITIQYTSNLLVLKYHPFLCWTAVKVVKEVQKTSK